MIQSSEKTSNVQRAIQTSKSVIIHLGCGDLYTGFPKVSAQLWSAQRAFPEQFMGGLPAAPELVMLYQNWQLIYKHLCDRKQLRSLTLEEDDELEIDEGGITNVSQISFTEICQQLETNINGWLQSREFLNIERQLRSQLHPDEEIRVMIETSDEWVRRLPWHRWDFFNDYPHAEMALSRPEYRCRSQVEPRRNRKKVRILAILSDTQGLDLEAERKFLDSLPDAETAFLVQPTRQELNMHLWSSEGWDLLFFAGHSRTEGETGRIYINENLTNHSLTIEQAEEAIKAAIDRGLKLAIFNSCDGLGLALALEKLNLPTVIAMREPVPNQVAQDFFKHFLDAFAIERSPLYVAVQHARRKLQGLEDDFPGASWLPVLCQNPATEPPTWLSLGGLPPCPYRGLFAFQEADAALFFGREQFTNEIVAAVHSKSLVAIVGPSGSGKSSVAFAGLIPELRSRAKNSPLLHHIVPFRPGNNPFRALAEAFSQHLSEQISALELDKSHGSLEQYLETTLRQDDQALYLFLEKIIEQPRDRIILIADQFEELYTLCPEVDCQKFLDSLLTVIRLMPSFTLVLTLRADFYGHALSYRPLSDALQGAAYNLGPMNREELQSSIESPAAQMQVRLESGLTQQLIQATWGQPGHLPLLEFALTQLWSQQQDGWLTNQAYQAIGGVEEALANHAEAVFTQFHEIDRGRIQRVLMQLVQPGMGTDASRRIATRDEVGAENWDLVTHLASSRLVVTNRHASTGEETIEIVHEALIRSWKRLGQWFLVDGEFRHWQEQLRSAQHQWLQSGQDEGVLLRGKPLTDAEYWLLNRPSELSSGDRLFIQQSLALRDRQLKFQKRRRKLTVLGLTGGLMATLMLTGVTLWQWQTASLREIKAIAASSEAMFASHDELGAIREAIRSGRKLNALSWRDANTENRSVKTLQQLLYRIKEANRFQGHESRVNAIAYSPDGQKVASASADGTVKLWKSDGTLLHTLNGQGSEVNSIAFSPDGHIVAAAGKDRIIRLWTTNGEFLNILSGHEAEVHGIAFSPDGQRIATAGWDGKVNLWSIGGALIKTLRGKTHAYSTVSFSPDGQTLAAGGWNGKVSLWSQDGTFLKTIVANRQNGQIYRVTFSPNGQQMATASDDNTVKLWSREGQLLNTLSGHTDVVWDVSFSPNGETLATASQDRTIKLWKPNGLLLTTISGHNDSVRGVAFSPNSGTLASGSADGTIKLWKPGGTPLKTLVENSSVYAVAFSSDGQRIATASDDKTIKLWTRDGGLLKTLSGHQDRVLSIAFSPDGQRIVSGGGEGTVKLWTRDGVLLKNIKGQDYDAVRAIAFSPNGQQIAIATDNKMIKLLTLQGASISIPGHVGSVSGVSFSPNGQMLASSSSDGTVRLWNLRGEKLQTLRHDEAVLGVSFSPDGQMLASGSRDGTVRFWKPDGTLLKNLNAHRGNVKSMTFSPNGQMVATASDDKTVKLWRRDGSLFRVLDGHRDWVWGISFSPDSQMLASASQDKTVILWNLSQNLGLGQLLSYGCDWSRDYLKTNSNVSDSDRTLCDGI